MNATQLGFAVLAAAMIAAALAFVLPALRRRPEHAATPTALALHVDTMRVALLELERQHADGQLDDRHYAEARSEIERRLLQEAPRGVAPPVTTPPRWVPAAVGVLVPLLAFALYAALGEPTMLFPSSATDATAGTDALARYASEHPRDARGWILLARAQARDERFAEAAAAYARAIEMPQAARDPGVHAEYADVLGMAQGGRLAGKPAALIAQALALDPRHPQALELAGSAAYEAGDFPAAAAHWRTLITELPQDDPRLQELAAAVSRAQRLAAVSLPALADSRSGKAAR